MSDAFETMLTALVTALTEDAALAEYVEAVAVADWTATRLPVTLPEFEHYGLVVTPVARRPVSTGCRQKADQVEVDLHLLVWAWVNNDGREELVEFATDVFAALNRNDLGGKLDLVDGDQVAQRLQYELIFDGFYWHAVVPLRGWLPAYTD